MADTDNMMKAAVNRRYGAPDVLEIEHLEKPLPAQGEILVKVHASTVTRTDWGMLRADPFIVRLFMGLTHPRTNVLGMDFAGDVEAVGKDVTAFKPGDKIFGMSPDAFGAHAEYLCIPVTGAIARMPEHLDYKDCVIFEGAWYALTYLDALGVGSDDKILIYGASGAIGTAAVQLAKALGANVTAVAATSHLELLKDLGADRIVDYTAEDFTQIGTDYDFVFDAGGKTSVFKCRKLLKPNGKYTATDFGPWMQTPLLALWTSLVGSKKVLFPLPESSKPFTEQLATFLKNGQLRAVIDRTYPLEQVADAYRYVGTKQKNGIVAIQVA